MKVVLKDGAPRNVGHVNVNVSKTGNTLEVGIEGTIAPVVLEYYDGKFKLRVYDGQNLLFFKELSAIPAPTVEPQPVTLAVAASQANAIANAEIVMVAPTPVPDTVETSDDDELAAFDAA